MRERTYASYTDYRRKKMEKETKGLTGKQMGLIIVGAVGLGAYAYGCFVGSRAGYRLGFDDGIIQTVHNFKEGMQILADSAELPKGE